VPKTYLPNYREFYERRHFVSGAAVRDETIVVAGREAAFGVDLLFRSEAAAPVTFHVEICEDFWVPLPPSTRAAMAGAELLLNLSASNIVIGKADTRRLLCASQSARAIAAYAYSAAGPGESTTDLAWDGHAAIFELGERLAETERFPQDSVLVCADVDLGRLRQERMRMNTFGDCRIEEGGGAGAYRIVACKLDLPAQPVALERTVERFPFVPSDPGRSCAKLLRGLQYPGAGLVSGCRRPALEKIVIGVSGGLDSTQALLVAARAMDRLALPRTNVLAYTLPGFATSEHTKSNAWALMRALGVTASEIDIRPAARQMLADLDHPFAKGEPRYDVTFENVQAGLRTDYLFRLANHHGGIVVGTGDLSELALGWCTYGVGDHMSHYNVNASVSKTLIQHLIRFVATSGEVDRDTPSCCARHPLHRDFAGAGARRAQGSIQSTEQAIGPYALQDFTLYYLTRFGFRPSKIAFLAARMERRRARAVANGDRRGRRKRSYTLGEIRSWMEVFLRRFFAHQFKRSALPNGPKMSSGGSLSPRGDWRAPSDASAAVWLAELEANVPRDA
jgi:NAD+ synthase (glutamine-hydrolysing)